MRLPVLQVSRVKDRRAALEVVEPVRPERFQVEEVPGVLLHGPAPLGLVHADVAGNGVEGGGHPAGGPRQPRLERRRLADREAEGEAAIEPSFHAPKW